MQKKKFLISWGAEVHWPIFPDFATFELFATKVAQNDPQWPIWPLKWLRLARNCQLWSIFNFSHLFPQKAAQMDSEWPISPSLHLLQSFPTKAAHFWPNFKKFLSAGGGTSANFLRFWNFSNCLQLKWLKMTHNGQYCHQSGLDWLKIANFG